MRFLVFGAGSLGSVFGGLLSLKNHKVCLIGRPSHINAIKKEGLYISGIWGNYHTTDLEAYSSIEELPPDKNQFDVILLTVKSFDTDIAINQCKPYVNKNTLVISLQNGYGNIEKLIKSFGKDKSIGARVIFGAEIINPGNVKVTVYADKVIIGSKDIAIPIEKLKKVSDIFNEAGIPSDVTSEIDKYIWGKILYNSALNPLSAILDVPYGALLEQESTKIIMTKIIKEIFLITSLYKIDLFWDKSEDFIQLFFDKLIPSTYAHTSSMLQDIHKGRKTEIDALNGAICNLAYYKSVEVPVNHTITHLIKYKENKTN